MTHRNFFVVAAAVFALSFAGACERSVGADHDAGADAEVQPDAQVLPDALLPEHIIEYTVSYPSVADIEIGSTNVDLIEVRMRNLHPSETAMVSDLGLSMHTSPWWNIENMELWVGGIPLDTEFSNSPGSLDMSAKLIADQPIGPGEIVSFLLQGDVWDGACFIFDVRFHEENTSVLGGTTDLSFDLRRSAQSAEVVERLGVGRSLVLGEASETVPEQYVPAGAANLPLVIFSLQSGVPATVDSLQIDVTYTHFMWDFASNPRLAMKNQNGDWIVVANSWFNPTGCTGTTCTLTFIDSFDLDVCAGNEMMFTVDLEYDAPVGMPISASMLGESIEAYDASDVVIPVPGNITGNFQYVVSPGP